MYYYYRVASLTLKSGLELNSFKGFSCDPAEADVTIEKTEKIPLSGERHITGRIAHRKYADGWELTLSYSDQKGVYINADYTRILYFGATEKTLYGDDEWLARIGLECWFVRHGYIIFHSAAVEKDGEAIAFTGPSGVGKSTRAGAWIESLNAKLINGDRPLIRVQDPELYGVPWDGKEQCFRNVSYPLKAICEVRRSDMVYIRKISFEQRRRLLLRQSFVPMWDTETAALQLANVTHLARQAEMVRIFSGPTGEDARLLYNALIKQEYLKEETDMKAKPGFVLRNVVDEYILMPTGENIGKFNGTVLLNAVSAFVWEKLQNPMSRDDLLKAILNEFEVDKATASADLDSLLQTLNDYGVIEDD
ncbi:MAG: PqqD family peptide modification chaperone [Clostridiales bacterium]|nr:PqqD family peptide modification chaperone [Clostridiales bacterium]